MLGKTPLATPPSSSATARPAIMAVWWLTLKDTYTDSGAKKRILIKGNVMTDELLYQSATPHTGQHQHYDIVLHHSTRRGVGGVWVRLPCEFVRALGTSW